jgi:hypothetical protein
MTTVHSTRPAPPAPTTLARALRNLYFIRTGFSLVWVALLFAVASTAPALMTALLVLYPAWDVLATLRDLQINRAGGTSRLPQYLNVGLGLGTTAAVALALPRGVPAVLVVFGAWAVLSGLLQLVLAWRRRQLGGQWPLIISGAQSMLGGSSFVLLAHEPTMGLTSLGGYAAFGAFYFLLAALRLHHSLRGAAQ